MTTPAVTALTNLFGPLPEPDIYRDKILDAAAATFAEHGLRRTSLADIAKAAGCSDRTVYRRFGDRDALITALVMREWLQLTKNVDKRLAHIDDPAEKLVQAFVVFARTLRAHEVLQRLLVTDPDTVLPLLTTHAGPTLELATPWIASYIADLPLRTPPKLLAELLARIAVSLTLTPSEQMRINNDEQAEQLARTLFIPLVLGVTHQDKP